MSDQNSYTLNGARVPAREPPPGLYVVATPIGNLGDVTIRALETLAGASLIACEDTRVSAKLLRRYGIDRPLATYHDHSGPRAREGILARIAAGEAVALICDAGTPLLSDPGYRLVAEAIAAGHAVVPIPGPSSITTALAAAGLPTDRFLFCGFPPAKAKARRGALADLAAMPATLVVMEAPHRLAATLADMAAILGAERPAAVCRELTKVHETILRDRLGALAASYEGASVKGEIVIIVAPPSGEADETADEDLDRAIAAALETQSVRDTVLSVSATTGVARGRVYQRALAIRKAGSAGGTGGGA